MFSINLLVRKRSYGMPHTVRDGENLIKDWSFTRKHCWQTDGLWVRIISESHRIG